jgi:hypothetical protein
LSAARRPARAHRAADGGHALDERNQLFAHGLGRRPSARSTRPLVASAFIAIGIFS